MMDPDWIKNTTWSTGTTAADDYERWKLAEARRIWITDNSTASTIQPLTSQLEKLEAEIKAVRKQTADFLAWLQWAHPELRDEYHKCLEVAGRIEGGKSG